MVAVINKIDMENNFAMTMDHLFGRMIKMIEITIIPLHLMAEIRN